MLVAFVGESGSGKTTLAKLLVRLYEQEKGNIKLDSVDIRDFPISQIRNNFSYISQNAFLFSGTIKENLLFGNSDASDNDILRVCKICELEEYINSLPLKYNTRIEENGKNLSGGQKQRLAMSWAMILDPDILILDDSLSAVDAKTEYAIIDNLKHTRKDKTTIITAHRLSAVVHANLILVMQDGRIIERGRHEDLLAKGG